MMHYVHVRQRVPLEGQIYRPVLTPLYGRTILPTKVYANNARLCDNVTPSASKVRYFKIRKTLDKHFPAINKLASRLSGKKATYITSSFKISILRVS